MNLDELFDQFNEDGRLNRTQPHLEAERTPHLHSKYMKLLVRAKSDFSRKDAAYKKLWSDKWHYYSIGPKSDQEAVLRNKEWKTMPVRGQKYIKQDLEMTLNGDLDVIEARLARDDAQNLLQALEEIVKQINNRGFHITSIIEWAKFQVAVAK